MVFEVYDWRRVNWYGEHYSYHQFPYPCQKIFTEKNDDGNLR